MKKTIIKTVCIVIALTIAACTLAMTASASELCSLYYGKAYPDSTVTMTQLVDGEWVYPYSYKDEYAEFELNKDKEWNQMFLELADLLDRYKTNRNIYAVLKYNNSGANRIAFAYRIDGQDENNIISDKTARNTSGAWEYSVLNITNIPINRVVNRILISVKTANGGTFRVAHIKFFDTLSEAQAYQRNMSSGASASRSGILTQSSTMGVLANVEGAPNSPEYENSFKTNTDVFPFTVANENEGKNYIKLISAIAVGIVLAGGLICTAVVIKKKKVQAVSHQ